MINYQMIYYQL